MLHRSALGKQPFSFWLCSKAERESAAAQRNHSVGGVPTDRQDPGPHRGARERLPGTPRCRCAAAVRSCLPLLPAPLRILAAKYRSFPLPGFAHADFYSQDLQIRGRASIKLALANCSESCNKSNANPHPPSSCSCQAPVTTICGKILLASTLARVSSSASVKTDP